MVRKWLKRVGVQTLFIEPGSPWENGYIESFNGKLRDELLNREIFYTLREAQVLIERWRQGVQHDPAAQLAGLPATRSAGDSACSSMAQTARTAGAGSGPEACGPTNLTCGTTLGGRSTGHPQVSTPRRVIARAYSHRPTAMTKTSPVKARDAPPMISRPFVRT